jgi:AAA15 family ATPase/GTPase
MQKYVDINKKLFDKYPIKFPVDEKLSVIYGYNGTGKTYTLEALKEYFEEQGENVIYFPTDRYFNLSEDEVDAIMVMATLTDDKNIFSRFGINLQPWDYADRKDTYIDSGYLQVVNFVGTIMLAKKPSIVLIDTVERSLHVSLKRIFLKALMRLDNTKKLIVTAYSPEVFDDLYDYDGEYEVPIKKCVNINQHIV